MSTEHSLAGVIAKAERDLADLEGERELAESQERAAQERLYRLLESVKPKSAVGADRYFEVGEAVFRRVGTVERDFGGVVGRCLRAQRMRLATARSLEVSGDAEWLQLTGECRVFVNEEEAAAHLASFGEEG